MALKRRGNNSNSKSDSDKPVIVCENLEEGKEYEARLVYVADLGLHENSYKGEVKPDVQKIALGYEVLGEHVTIDGEKTPRLLWGKPFNIYWKLTDKGAELAHYKIFNPSATEDEIADWESVLGSPVNLTVKHVSDKKDPTIKYDNIASVQAIPKKYQKGIVKNELESSIGDADDEDNPATKALYGLTKWMYDRRIVEGQEKEQVEEPNIEEDEIPF